MFRQTTYLNSSFPASISRPTRPFVNEDVTDNIVKIFAKKERKLKIDSNNYLLTPAESQCRIIKILATLSIVLCLTETLMLARHFIDLHLNDLKVNQGQWRSNNLAHAKTVHPLKRSHLLLINTKGQALDVAVQSNSSVKISWHLQLPHSKDYFAFTASRKVYVTYGKNLDTIWMKTGSQHRKIHGTTGNHNVFGFNGRIGDSIWMLGVVSLGPFVTNGMFSYLLAYKIL